MIIIRADRANAKAVSTQLLTSGMVGAQVKFVFSHEWDDLLKTAVFQVGDTTIDVLDSNEPAPLSPVDDDAFRLIEKTITSVFPDAEPTRTHLPGCASTSFST